MLFHITLAKRDQTEKERYRSIVLDASTWIGAFDAAAKACVEKERIVVIAEGGYQRGWKYMYTVLYHKRLLVR